MARLESLELPTTLGIPSLELEALNERFRLIAERLKSTAAAATSAGVLQATHTERLAQFAAEKQTVGAQFWETDRTAVYVIRQVKAAKVWQFETGLYVAAFALRPVDLSTYDAGFLFYASDKGVLWRWTGTAWVWVLGTINDTHANRATYTASAYRGAFYFENDTGVTYLASGSSWVYVTGAYKLNQASLAAYAATLGVNDVGTRVWVTDYAHELQWTGAAWQRGPGDPEHSDTFQFFGAAPADTGWHACDGSAAVNFLKYDGSLGTRNLPNIVGGSAYLKLASTYSETITAAAAPTFTGSAGTTGATSAGTPAGTISTPTFTGNALGNHHHESPIATDGSHNIYALNVNGTGGGATAIAVVAGTANATTQAPLLTDDQSAGTPSGTISTPTFTGSAMGTHTHSFTPAGTISLAGGDPIAFFQAIPYYRQ